MTETAGIAAVSQQDEQLLDAVYYDAADLRLIGAGQALAEVTADLKKITVPVLVMHGDDDQIVPYADSGPLSARLLPNGTLKTYPGFPHGMPTTQAETINADLLAFILSPLPPKRSPRARNPRWPPPWTLWTGPQRGLPTVRGSLATRVRSEGMVISSDELVRRNAAFAVTGAFAGLAFPTSETLQVLGCVDSRVDPGDVLGLEPGEGVVMRNIGGRITPAVLRSWALLGRLGQGQPPRSGHLVILHHTDCGITRLTDYPEQLAAFFEIPADDLESKAVADPYAAVRVDTAVARRALPPSRLVSGLVYDVSTGLIEIVDPATGE
jgi:carbonic anhydrase